MLPVPDRVLLYTLGPTLLLLLAAAFLTGWHRRVCDCRSDLRPRARALAPYVLLLSLVLGFNAYVRPRVDHVSPAFAINLTDSLYLFEGYFVSVFQEATPEPLLYYFAFIYVVGYAALLIFPLLAYAVLDDLRHAKTLLTTYALNYSIGAVAYVFVEAYGPRNLHVADGMLYQYFPDVQYLTSAVNSNANVFPSLHTSMAVAVLLLAYHSRAEYPRWFLFAAIVAPSVVLSTMALGIHWFADVVAGVVLAFVSVESARWLVPRLRRPERARDRQPVEQSRL